MVSMSESAERTAMWRALKRLINALTVLVEEATEAIKEEGKKLR